MPKKALADPHSDPRVQSAVRFLQRCTGATVPEALHAVGFSNAESIKPCVQMLVRRRMPAKKSSSRPKFVIAGSSSSIVSSLTSQTSSTLLHPPPKRSQKRTTSVRKQVERAESKRAREHTKKAHKRVTLLYAAEVQKKKEGKPSIGAAAVEKKVKAEYGHGPSKKTILREVREGRAGFSPKRKGPSGSMSPFVFNTLCIAFESYVNIKQLNGRGSEITKKNSQLGYVSASQKIRNVRTSAL